MRTHLHRALFAAPLLLPLFALSGDGPFRVTPDEACVVASRLVGAWEPDEELAKRLGTKARASRITFEADASVAPRVPEKYTEFFSDKPITLAGSFALVTTEGKKERYPFILIGFGGNQNVVCFRERDGDPFGDGESFILTVVPAREQADDLLFTGGDFNNEPFSAYRRVTDED